MRIKTSVRIARRGIFGFDFVSAGKAEQIFILLNEHQAENHKILNRLKSLKVNHFCTFINIYKLIAIEKL
jgi:hypothetical protein